MRIRAVLYTEVQRAFEKQLRAARLYVARRQPALVLTTSALMSCLASGFCLEVFAFVFQAGL